MSSELDEYIYYRKEVRKKEQELEKVLTKMKSEGLDKTKAWYEREIKRIKNLNYKREDKLDKLIHDGKEDTKQAKNLASAIDSSNALKKSYEKKKKKRGKYEKKIKKLQNKLNDAKDELLRYKALERKRALEMKRRSEKKQKELKEQSRLTEKQFEELFGEELEEEKPRRKEKEEEEELDFIPGTKIPYEYTEITDDGYVIFYDANSKKLKKMKEEDLPEDF